MEEIMVIKTKKGWKAYDRQGNFIEAPTKEMARMKYYAHFVQPNSTSNLFHQEEIKCENL